MSTPHHGKPSMRDPEKTELIERFNEQITQEYRRTFPEGRINAEDDGDLTFAITCDDRHRTIIIRFAHPTEWIGMDVKAAQELCDNLTERIMYLKGLSVGIQQQESSEDTKTLGLISQLPREDD